MSTVTIATVRSRSEPVARRGFWRGMLWLTWRQHRWPIVVGAVVTAGMLIWMATTAAEINDGLAVCKGLGVSCPRLTSIQAQAKLDHGYSFATYELNTVVSLPVLPGLFWGVPVLAREYDQRTLMLAWSQDVSPLKWLWGKLALLGTAAAVLAALLAGAAVHVAYLAHLAGARSLFEGTLFQGGGWLPLTLALGWFAFGVAAGAVVRRTMPALALVAGAFVARTVLMARFRPYFMTPTSMVKSLGDGDSAVIHRGASQAVADDLSLSGGSPQGLDAAGHAHDLNKIIGTCVSNYNQPGDPGDSYLDTCVQQHGIVGIQHRFQPASRMGTFHLIENGLNLGLLVLSLAVTWWFVRRARTTV